MGKIKDLPPLDRPREKAFRYGLDSLSEQELLSILIASGYQGMSANDIASRLLSSSNGLLGLSEKSLSALLKEKGIKKAKALTIATIFEIHRRIIRKEIEIKEDKVTTQYLYNKYKDELSRSDQEELILIILDGRHKIISEQSLYKGTGKQLIFSYHEIWKQLYSHNGKAFFLIHNHPDGDEHPSQRDVLLTQELFRESKRIEIPLIDHIIIGQNNYYSFQKS